MASHFKSSNTQRTLVLSVALLLSACGGGNSSEAPPQAGAASTSGDTSTGTTSGVDVDGLNVTVTTDGGAVTAGGENGTAGADTDGLASGVDGGCFNCALTTGGITGTVDIDTSGNTAGGTDGADDAGNGTDGTSDVDNELTEFGTQVDPVFDVGELQEPIGDFGPYAQTAQQAYQDYLAKAGNNEAALLNASNAALFLDTILFGPLSNNMQGTPIDLTTSIVGFGHEYENFNHAGVLRPFYEIATVAQSGTRYCSYYSNGPMTWQPSEPLVYKGKHYRQVSIHYDRCYVNDVRLNGTVTYALSDEAGIDLTKARFFQYDDLEVRLADNSTVLRFTGVDALAYGMSCDASRPMRSYTHIENQSTQASWLFQNVVASRYNSTAADLCPQFTSDEDAGSVLSGQVAHSAHGVVNIPQTATGVQASLSFQINGADSQVAFEKHMLLAPSEISTDEYDIVPAIPMATATFSVADQVVFQSTQRRDVIRLGGFSSLTDSDADGMSDAWELIHGLNPANAADASSNADQDYLNALQEYSLGTHPDNGSEAGWLSDHWIYLSIPENSALSIDAEHDRYPLRVFVRNDLDRVRSKRFSFTLQLEGEAVFESAIPQLVDQGTELEVIGDVSCEFVDATGQLLNCEATTDTQCDVQSVNGNDETICETNFLANREFSVVHQKGAFAQSTIKFFASAELAVGSQEIHDINNYHTVFEVGQ